MRWIAAASLVLCVTGAAHAQAAPKPAPERAAQAQTDEAGFDVMEYQIEGNSVLPALAIERAVYPFLGERKTIRDVERARDALERAYRDAGYLTVVVDIPEQKVDAGLVRLAVTEGSVDRVRVTGSRYYSLGAIRSSVPSLATGTVPYFPDVQEEIAQLNRSADRRVTPVLKPGRAPGTVEFELKVEDKLPLHGSLELNDRYSANTSRLRAAGYLRYDNLWQLGHSLSFNFVTAPEEPSETTVFSASYLFAWPQSKTTIALYAVRSNSDVAAVGGINVLGSGTIYGARAIFPLPSLEGYFHTFTLGLDYKDFGETVQLLGADGFDTPISYAPLSFLYNATLAGDSATTQFSLGATLGVRDFLGSRDQEFANKRFKARANYAYLRGDVQHTRQLPRGWTLHARADAQLAGQPLISNEQFAAGGADSVRGYLEAEQLGDDGVRGKLELRAPFIGVGNDEDKWFDAQGLAFIEAAALRVVDPLPDQESRFRLASAGLGLRIKAWRFWQAAFDVAWPLRTTSRTLAREPRLSFRLSYEF